MRTARLLTVGGGVCLAEMFVWGGGCVQGVMHTRPDPEAHPLPRGQTGTTPVKISPWHKLRLRAINIGIHTSSRLSKTSVECPRRAVQ